VGKEAFSCARTPRLRLRVVQLHYTRSIA